LAGRPRLGSAHAGAGRRSERAALAGRDERWAENRKKMIFLFFFFPFLIFQSKFSKDFQIQIQI
jgi:hypothetical protein